MDAPAKLHGLDRLIDITKRTVQCMVDHEDDVGVHIESVDGHTRVCITVAQSDFGKVVGRQGRNVDALRLVMNAVGHKLRLPTCSNAEGEWRVCAHIYVEDPDKRGRNGT